MTYEKTLLAVIGVSLLLISKADPAQSLGEVSRELRKKRVNQTHQAVKVYTNDNITQSSHAEPAPPRLEEMTPTPAEAAGPNMPPAPQPPEPKTEGKVKTREYWQGRFHNARSALARAREEQKLVEDELSLLQIQQVRELDPNLQKKLRGRIKVKLDELEIKRASTQKAGKALQELQMDFKESGAPEDWIKDKND